MAGPLGVGRSWSAFGGSSSSVGWLRSISSAFRCPCSSGVRAVVPLSSVLVFRGGSRWSGGGCVSAVGCVRPLARRCLQNQRPQANEVSPSSAGGEEERTTTTKDQHHQYPTRSQRRTASRPRMRILIPASLVIERPPASRPRYALNKSNVREHPARQADACHAGCFACPSSKVLPLRVIGCPPRNQRQQNHGRPQTASFGRNHDAAVAPASP